MLIAVLVSALILATVLCFYVPVPLISSLAVGGYVWWLFLGYRNVLAGRSMSGDDLSKSRSGLLEGYRYGNRDKGSPLPVVPNERRGYDVRRTFDSREYGSPSKVGMSPGRRRLSSGVFSSPTPSPRVSSMSASRDEPFSPFSSPSVSSLISRPSYMENLSYRSDERRTTSPMLPPGSYPWIVPHNGSATNRRLSLEAVPVKIKVSKPTSRFKPAPEVQEDESIKTDKSLQIIQALKALSRKRLHTTGSDDEADDSGNSIANVPKRRPLDFHQNLYASHLGSSDSSFPEIQEETQAEHRTANGSDSFNYTNVATTNNAVTPTNNVVALTNNVVATTNNMNTLANHVVPQTNKRPRAANDSGNQLSKRRNNEILSSLSSSLALLDPSILQRPRKRRDNDAIPSKRLKTLETLHTSVEVQTLPSPILKDDTPKKKEDKGTATDKVVESGITYSRPTPQMTAQSIPEKKVTGKMAAAIYKSALIKFANSGELITPDTSATSTSVLSDTSLSKSDVSVSIAQAVPFEASKPAEVSVSFGAATEVPNAVSSAVSNGTLTMPSLVKSSDKVNKPSVAPSSFVVGSGAPTQSAFPSIGGSNDPNQPPPAPIKSSVAPATTAVASTEKPSGFTLGTADNTMAITPSPPDTSKMFTFGSSTVAASKTNTTPTTAVPTMAPASSKPVEAAQSYSFGAQPSGDNKPAFTFGAPSAVVTSSAPNAPASTAPIGLSAAPSMTAAASATFTFGQNSSAVPAPLQQEKPNISSSPFKLGTSIMGSAVTTASSGQTATTESKPGGFPFAPTAKFNFGAPQTPSTTVVASTASSTQPTPQIFSFGSGFSQKQEAGPKTLFGMPPPPAATSANAVVPSSVEPPKLFGSSPSGFSFSQTVSKEQPKMAFPSAAGVAKPEEKKQDSYVFGGQKPEPSKLFAFGAQEATTEPPKPPFAFGAGVSAPPAFGSFSGKSAESTGGSMFNLPATTTSSLFGSTSTPAVASGFGSTASKTPLSFGAPATTAPATGFGTSTITTSTNPTPTFGSGLTSMGSTVPSFGSTAPAFGSSAPAFGSPSMTFGSGSSGFGSTNPPTFGSVAAVPSAPSTTAPAPAFGSSATPQFGSGAFGSTAPTVPAFGSSFPSAPSFGAPQTTSQPPSSAPFNFSAPATPAAPSASGGYNFQPPGQQPRPMFQFGAGATPVQPAAAPPFSFGAGAPVAAPGVGGFTNTMFSIGSGSSTPRSRMTSRSRKK